MKEKSKAGKATKTKPAGRKSKKSALERQLVKIIKDVDEEGLLFLIKQANVLVYNQRVDDLNKVRTKAGQRVTKQQPFSDKISMDIKEADDNSSFIFVINKARKFFTLEEMKKIVKLCHLSPNAGDASKRLYTWFKNNRGDVLNDIGIDDSGDLSLKTIYDFIIKRYTVKQ